MRSHDCISNDDVHILLNIINITCDLLKYSIIYVDTIY